jgi:hypothetical protein
MPTGSANHSAAATIVTLTAGAARPVIVAAHTTSHAIAGNVGIAYLT